MKWSNLKLTLPVNDAGKPSGKPAALTLTSSTQKKPWFTQTASQAKFECPAKGATTPNSTRTRCECGEIKTWNAQQGGTMELVATITATCDRTNLAQIHAEVGEPMKLALESDGTFDLVDEQDANGPVVHYKLSPDVRWKIGQQIKARLWMNRTTQGCEVTVDGVTGKAAWPLTAWWMDSKRQMKFRFPIYRGSDDNAAVKLTLHSYKITHP